MIDQGPIPPFFHGLLDYAAAVIFIAAPFLFSFDSGAATAISIIVGVAILLLAATTEGTTSLTNSVPVRVHVGTDLVLGPLLIAAPFIFGFSGESAPTAFFIVAGVLLLLVTIGTRFERPAARS
jgi:hypothetical protein